MLGPTHWVWLYRPWLNDQETEGPDETYRSVDSLEIEALQGLADDIQAAARASAAIMTRTAERRAEKGAGRDGV